MTPMGMKASATLLVFACASMLSAQTVVAPGQIAAAPKFFGSDVKYAVAPSPSVVPKTSIASVKETDHDKKMNRLWVGSIMAMLAGSSLDAYSSMGKYESNTLLASSNGKFGERGIALKAVMASAVVIPQALLVRKHEDLRWKFALGNFVEAAVFSGVAVHNLGIPVPKN